MMRCADYHRTQCQAMFNFTWVIKFLPDLIKSSGNAILQSDTDQIRTFVRPHFSSRGIVEQPFFFWLGKSRFLLISFGFCIFLRKLVCFWTLLGSRCVHTENNKPDCPRWARTDLLWLGQVSSESKEVWQIPIRLQALLHMLFFSQFLWWNFPINSLAVWDFNGSKKSTLEKKIPLRWGKMCFPLQFDKIFRKSESKVAGWTPSPSGPNPGSKIPWYLFESCAKRQE